MIVYGEDARAGDPRARLREAAAELAGLAGHQRPEHDRLRDLLIGFGEVEAALADGLAPDCDILEPRLGRLRQVAIGVGRLFWASWRGHWNAEARARAACLAKSMDELCAERWPERTAFRVPEGYAHYALYPECYVEAAAAFAAADAPGRAAVIGLRSIGTSLSAAVAGTLAECGVAVESWCLRPHGHPFRREILCAPELERALASAAQSGSSALIVDEGPGLSGSSFAAAAEKLSRTGFTEDRILLMPSWLPDRPPFAGEKVAQRWGRHRKLIRSFESVFIETHRLCAEGEDLSAGRWRQLLEPGREWPAVQPQHERRKYLVRGGGRGPVLLKFAGLGHYGRARQERAQVLAEAGFIPPVRGLADGFLRQDFVLARPLEDSPADRRFLDHAVRYLAFRARTFPTGRSVRFDALLQMIRVNCTEAIGPETAGACDALAQWRSRASDRGTVAVDGRMHAYEWLLVPNGTYLKADAVDHADDHFFPRDQDIAWDVAGCSAEFGLNAEEEEAFTARAAEMLADLGLPARLPFYGIAYRSYQMGYAALAIEALGPADPDARRFARRLERLRAELRQRLARIS